MCTLCCPVLHGTKPSNDEIWTEYDPSSGGFWWLIHAYPGSPFFVASLYGCPRSDDCGASVGRLSSPSWLLRPADETVQTDELDGKHVPTKVLETLQEHVRA